MREEQCSEKLVRETREAYLVVCKMKRATDAEARETLSGLSSESLEKAMWLVRSMHNTVDNMRIAQDEMTLQVVKVQDTRFDLFKARQKAEETRQQIYFCKGGDEAAKIET